MKKLLILASLFTAIALQAQAIRSNNPPVAATAVTNTPPTSSTSFFDTVQGWIISQNPENAWTNSLGNRGSMSAGVASIQNSKASLCNEINFSYNLWKGISLEATTRDSGVQGTFVSGSGGAGYAIKVVDVRLVPYVQGGRDLINEDRWFIEAGLRAEKRMTKWTHIGLAIANQFPKDRRVFSAYAGFSF